MCGRELDGVGSRGAGELDGVGSRGARELDGVGSRGARELDGVGAERLVFRAILRAVLAYLLLWFCRTLLGLGCAPVLPGLS